jgi:hypothetical protein
MAYNVAANPVNTPGAVTPGAAYDSLDRFMVEDILAAVELGFVQASEFSGRGIEETLVGTNVAQKDFISNSGIISRSANSTDGIEEQLIHTASRTMKITRELVGRLAEHEMV